MGMHNLMGKEQQFQHAYEVTGRGCRISRVRKIRSNMPTRNQVGAAGSHGLGTTDRTCLLCIRSGLQKDLTVSKQLIQHAYKVERRRGCKISRIRKSDQDGGCRISRMITPYHTCLQSIRTGLHDLTGKDKVVAAGSYG